MAGKSYRWQAVRKEKGKSRERQKGVNISHAPLDPSGEYVSHSERLNCEAEAREE